MRDQGCGPMSPANRRILIVDDSEAIHSDFRKLLQVESMASDLSEIADFLFDDEALGPASDEGFDVTSALQGQQALDMVCAAVAERRPYAMAFVDMRMPPGWDGLTTIKRLWEQDPLMEMVICTAYADQDWPTLVAEIGDTDQLLILKKPFDGIEVTQLARSLTGKWSHRREVEEAHTALEELVARTKEQLEWTRNALDEVMRERTALRQR